MDFEQKGYEFYIKLADEVNDAKVKKLLVTVANEELKHKEYLKLHQDAVYNTGYWYGVDHVRLEM
jgi:rubrerythrin